MPDAKSGQYFPKLIVGRFCRYSKRSQASGRRARLGGGDARCADSLPRNPDNSLRRERGRRRGGRQRRVAKDTDDSSRVGRILRRWVRLRNRDRSVPRQRLGVRLVIFDPLSSQVTQFRMKPIDVANLEKEIQTCLLLLPLS